MIKSIAFDAASSDYTSNSINHTVASDATLVVAGARLNDDDVFTATFGGVAMTNIQTLLNVSANRRTTLFYLENPPTGTQSFAVSSTGATSGFFVALSFKNAAYCDPTDRTADYSGSNENSHAISLTSLSRECWMLAWSRFDNYNTSYTFDIGTNRVSDDNGGVVINIVNTLLVSALSSKTFTATSTPGFDGIHEMIGVEIRPRNYRGLTF